jgi:hypothetical protein
MRLLLLMAVPLCKTCKYYMPHPDDSLAKCKKIGTVDVVNGDVEYSSALSVREFACGEQGLLYRSKPGYLTRVKNYLLRKYLGLG